MNSVSSGLKERITSIVDNVYTLKINGLGNRNSFDQRLKLLSMSDTNHSSNDDSESETHNGVTDSPKSKKEVAEEASCLTISIYSAVIIALVCTFLVVGRDYVKYLLISMEESDVWISFIIFTGLFTVVSFPMTWGYILFNIAAGYLYGFRLGLITVMVCALSGLSIAHFVIKKLLRKFVIRKLTNDTVKAIIRVIDSGHGFRVVILSRLTPIPFGLQNGLFAISKISYPRYILASALGMAPSQGMHAYIGSTLRSMEEVMAGGSSNSPTAYLVFIGQLMMAAVLLVYIIRRARAELNKTVQELDVPSNNTDSLFDLGEKGELINENGISPRVEPYFDKEHGKNNIV